MFPRSMGILLVALLAMVTLQVAFEFQNHRLLSEMLRELRTQSPVSGAGMERRATVGAAASPLARSQPAAPSPPPSTGATPNEPAADADSRRLLTGAAPGGGAGSPGPPGQTQASTAPPDPARDFFAPTRSSAPDRPAPAGPAPAAASDPASARTDQPPADAPPAPPGSTAPTASPADSANPAQPPLSLENPAQPPEPSESQASESSPTETDAPQNPSEAPEPQPRQESPAPPDPWRTHGRAVMKIMQNMFAGRYDAVREQFSPRYASNLSPSGLRSAIEPIRSEHGGLKELDAPSPTAQDLGDGLTLYTVPVKLADGHRLVLKVTLDEQDKVHGLLFAKRGNESS